MEFDKRLTYELEIQPYVKDLAEMCASNGLPFFLAIAVQNDANGTIYAPTSLLPQALGYCLQEDRLAVMKAVLLGEVAIMKETDLIEEIPYE